MTWKKKRVLVTVKAAPETSQKYGESVCTAGITEHGEFIRLYPIILDNFKKGRGFRKFDWIEVECDKAEGEILGRRESYRVDVSVPIRVVDSSLSTKVKGRTNWAERNRILKPLIAGSIEELEDAYRNDKTSLGLIHVRELLRFYKSHELTDEQKQTHHILQSYFDFERESASLKKTWVLQQIPHIFKYTFKCEGVNCRTHDMTCEDWELFESYRSWPEQYETEDLTWSKIEERYFDWMKKRNLHFFMGMDSRWPVWMIIGLYYPPRNG